MDIGHIADAVTGAVAEILSFVPQIGFCDRVQKVTGGSERELLRGQSDVGFQHVRVILFHFFCQRTERDRSG